MLTVDEMKRALRVRHDDDAMLRQMIDRALALIGGGNC